METKQRILDSTIKFIAKNGYHSVTNRKITELAQVNSASINYYFNSQEHLLNQALRVAINKALEPIEFHLDSTRNSRNENLGKALSKYFTHIIEDKLLISAVIIDPAKDIALREKTLERYSSILFKMYQGIIIDSSGDSKRNTECIFYQLLAASLSTLLHKDEVQKDIEKNFPENSVQFNIEKKLEHFLNNKSI